MKNLPRILLVAEPGYQQMGLLTVLNALPSVNVIAARPETAMRVFQNGSSPEIALIDSSLTPSDRIRLVRAIKKCSAHTPCVFLANGDTYSKLQELPEYRLDETIIKTNPISELSDDRLKLINRYRSNAGKDTDEEAIESLPLRTSKGALMSGIRKEL